MKNNVIKANINSLIHDDINANKGTDEGQKLIEKSLRELGAGRSILLDKNNRIIAGNKTIENANIVGLKDIVIIETNGKQIVAVKRTDIDLNTQKGRELALADNSTSKVNIEWDQENIKKIQQEWGIDIESWGMQEFSEFKPIDETIDDDFEMPEKVKTDIVPGDFFKIGDHRLLCGDSTISETYNKLFKGSMADLVVTDPPYNVDYTGATKDKLKIKNDNMTNDNFYKFLYSFYSALASFTKKGAAWYVWHADSEGINFRLAMTNSGIKVRQCLIWVKSSLVMGRQDYHWKHEPCLYGWTDGGSHNWYADRKQTTVLEFDKPNRNADHPTMKPVPLISYQINNSSKINDIVVDAFAGSGTTMVAAHKLNRRAYVVELDPNYCQVIIDRMKNMDNSIEITKISA